MPKYIYSKLFVSASEPRYFDPLDSGSLRLAVECLRQLPESKFVTLTVEAKVRAGNFKLIAPAALRLGQILGKTPAQVWELFDSQIDDQIEYFERRG